jgi:hypothetical protein
LLIFENYGVSIAAFSWSPVFQKKALMKKFILLFFLVLFFCPLIAQTNKGDQLVSGLTNARIYGNRFRGGVVGSVDGIYQYFIFRNFSVGAGLEYNFHRILYDGQSYSFRSYYFLPEARYYFFNGKLRPYVYANGGPGFSTIPGYGALPLSFKYEAGVGFSWFFSERFALESRLGVKGFASQGTNGLSGFDFKIGVQYSIPSRKNKPVPQ